MIRLAAIGDIPRLLDLGEQFAATVPAMANFNREIAHLSWTSFIESDIALVLMIDDYSGMLAAIISPDPYTGELVATEMAWFVSPDNRGGGIRLLAEFEKRAKQVGCKRIIMAHLITEQTKQLEKLYERRGYVPLETHYIKDI